MEELAAIKEIITAVGAEGAPLFYAYLSVSVLKFVAGVTVTGYCVSKLLALVRSATCFESELAKAVDGGDYLNKAEKCQIMKLTANMRDNEA